MFISDIRVAFIQQIIQLYTLENIVEIYPSDTMNLCWIVSQFESETGHTGGLSWFISVCPEVVSG